ncbi:MAG: GNAT family N-acetyltransferase [Oscillospiraceae bacterium]|nr:GNAT family N-acetyltransferase [Oscillospiraceae bacterium]
MPHKLTLPLNTERLIITEFTPDMAQSVHLNSLDADNREFQPDEVFETLQDALETITELMSFYGQQDAPLVYPILLKNGEQIGHIQAVPYEDGWEIGYHIGSKHTKNGYATEAVKAFLPAIMQHLSIKNIYGVCRADNYASCKVLERNGFALIDESMQGYHGDNYLVRIYIYSLGDL